MAALCCHQSKVQTCRMNDTESESQKNNCCKKFLSKKKIKCQHHKQCPDCSCHCTPVTSILALSTAEMQLPKIPASSFKKSYGSLLFVYLLDGYFYPWVPPKIS